MTNLLNTFEQIVHSDSIGPFRGILRHSGWQLRKLFGRFPCELPISTSHLYVDRPGGVAALVNAMGEYDFNNMRLLGLVLSQGQSTFFDIGANIGSYTLISSESPNACVVSIEPHPRTFALLKLNVELNARNNVLCLNLALSDEEGDVLLSDYSEPERNRVVRSSETETRGPRVRCRRFDCLCDELEFFPDFVKIDVEGHEKAVLDGFGDLITETKMIIIEGGEGSELRSLLQSAGYNGPWFCHFKQRRLSKRKQSRPEDPVYVGQNFMPDLRKLDFVIG